MKFQAACRAIQRLVMGHVPGLVVIRLPDYTLPPRRNHGTETCEMDECEQRKFLKIKRIIDAASKQGVMTISFFGGELLNSLTLIQKAASYAVKAGIPFIQIDTTGRSLLPPYTSNYDDLTVVAERLAISEIRNIWFTLYGDVKSAGNSQWNDSPMRKTMERFIPLLHSYGIYPSVRLRLTTNISSGYETKSCFSLIPLSRERYLEILQYDYRVGISNLLRHISDLGFTTMGYAYPISTFPADSENGHSGDLDLDFSYGLQRDQKRIIVQTLIQIVQELRWKIRTTTPLSSLFLLDRQLENTDRRVSTCRGGIDYFYVDSRNGRTHPCPQRSNENLGIYWHHNHGNSASIKKECSYCDWAQFTNPSALFHPLIELCSNPLQMYPSVKSDIEFYRLWFEDIRYFNVCDWFNGRKPPDMTRLARYSPIPTLKGWRSPLLKRVGNAYNGINAVPTPETMLSPLLDPNHRNNTF